jgi:hypothetical protein
VQEYPDFAQKSQRLTQGFTKETNPIFQQLWSSIPTQPHEKSDDDGSLTTDDTIRQHDKRLG